MKKTKILAVALIIAFASLGGAYALWYDSLFIDETVETGMLDIKWECFSTSDGGSTPDHMEKDNPRAKKNVGSESFALLPDDETLPAFDGFGNTVNDTRHEDDAITLAFKNTYPGYQEDLYTFIDNKGDIPVKLTRFKVAEGEVPSWIHLVIYNRTTKEVYYDNLGKNQVKEDIGLQIDPGGYVFINVKQRVLSGAPQHAVEDEGNEVTFEVEGVQWNAYNYDEMPADDTRNFKDEIDTTEAWI